MKKITFLIAFLSSQIIFAAQITQYYSVKIKVRDKQDIDRIAKVIHIDKIDGKNLSSVVNSFDYLKLKEGFSDLIVQSKLVSEFDQKNYFDEDVEFPPGKEAFHTYKELLNLFETTIQDYPLITQSFNLGNTVEETPIPAIKINKIDSPIVAQPGILFIGSHHAREHLSTEIAVELIKMLTQSYNKDSQITDLINTREIYIVPMLNVDGAMFDIQGRRFKYWRKNRSVNGDDSYGVDLNRNYSFDWGRAGSSSNPESDVFQGPEAFSEPETKAIKKFIEDHPNIKIIVSLHTYSELVLYPWGGRYEQIGGKDQKVFEIMAQSMAKWNKYRAMQSSELYAASGDLCDWAYAEHKMFCFTFELSPQRASQGGFYPEASIIDQTFKANKLPFTYLIEHSLNPYAVLP